MHGEGKWKRRRFESEGGAKARVVQALCLMAFAAPIFWGTSRGGSDSAYAPLWEYQGVWRIGHEGGKAEELVNRCSRIGKYFACEQTVDGKLEALIVFLPAGSVGRYYTQAITAEGMATGRGELEIAGEKWVYGGRSEKDDKGFIYRTVNLFRGADRIHYEQQRSADGQTWTTTSSGDEVRISKTASVEGEKQ